MKKIIFLTLFVIFFLFAPNSKFLGSSFLYVKEKDNNFEIPLKEIEEPIRIMSFGDMMLGRYVDTLMQKNGYDYPFLALSESVEGYDFLMANLEGPITDINLQSKNNMKFRFDKSVLPVLKEYGFDVLNLANNHSFDQGKDGFLDTKKYLDDAGINYFGDSLNQKGNLSSIVNIRGKRIAFIGVNFTWNSFNLNEIKKEIERLNDLSDIVIASVHWGDEYKKEKNNKQKIWSRILIDSGVDIIFGHHPHVVQGVEIYKNKAIFYSLGNFIFDQYFSDDVKEGLAVSVSLDNDVFIFELLPFRSDLSQPYFIKNKEKDLFLSDLAKRSSLSVRKDIKDGIIVLRR